MSLAMQSLTASAAPTRAATHAAAVEHHGAVPPGAPGAERTEDGKAPKGRNALLGALTQALDELASASAGDAAPADTEEPSASDRESKHALPTFVHELFAALRPTDAEGRHGRGFAWGRTSLADLAQRLDTLVQRLQGGAASPSEPRVVDPAPEVPASAPTPSVETSSGGAAVASTPIAPAPDEAKAATGGVATDSPLLSAFRQLLAARSPGEAAGAGAADGSDALVALLQRMSRALAGDAATDAPIAGSLLDVTA